MLLYKLLLKIDYDTLEHYHQVARFGSFVKLLLLYIVPLHTAFSSCLVPHFFLSCMLAASLERRVYAPDRRAIPLCARLF